MSFDVIFAYGLDRISDSEKAPSVWSKRLRVCVCVCLSMRMWRVRLRIWTRTPGRGRGGDGGIVHLNLNSYELGS